MCFCFIFVWPLTFSDWWLQTWLLFSIIYGMSSFPLTFIFFRGVQTTNQFYFCTLANWSPYVRISMVRSAAGCSDERCQRERLREWIGGAAAEGGRHHGFWVLVMLSAYWQALIFTSLNRSTDTYVYIAGDTQVYRYCICVEWCGYECLLVKLMQFSTKWFLLKGAVWQKEIRFVKSWDIDPGSPISVKDNLICTCLGWNNEPGYTIPDIPHIE